MRQRRPMPSKMERPAGHFAFQSNADEGGADPAYAPVACNWCKTGVTAALGLWSGDQLVDADSYVVEGLGERCELPYSVDLALESTLRGGSLCREGIGETRPARQLALDGEGICGNVYRSLSRAAIAAWG